MKRYTIRFLRVSQAFVLAVAVAALAQSALAADGPAKKLLPRKNRGRLPAYYAKVVTDQQQEQIYKIQAEYDPKIKALGKQLDELRKERDGRIQSVLTPEQKKQVEDAKATAKTKRAANGEKRAESAAKPKPAEKPIKESK